MVFSGYSSGGYIRTIFSDITEDITDISTLISPEFPPRILAGISKDSSIEIPSGIIAKLSGVLQVLL